MTLSHVVQSVIRQVVGDNTMDHVLTTGREQVAQEVKTASQGLLNEYNTGLLITAVTMQDAQPPIQVKAPLMMLSRLEKMSKDTSTRRKLMPTILFLKHVVQAKDLLLKRKPINLKLFLNPKVRLTALLKF